MTTLVVGVDMDCVKHLEVLIWPFVVFGNNTDNDSRTGRLVKDIETEYCIAINLHVWQHGHRVVIPVESPGRHIHCLPSVSVEEMAREFRTAV